MWVVGVTGGIGSGKTAATDYFQTLGIDVVDADLVARLVVEPGQPALAKIAEHFGEQVIQPDGSLDRTALRSIVFADPTQRTWLEQLTHPLIGQEIRRQLANSQSAYSILASPLLLESGQKDLTQRILLIDVPVELQISRTVKRDNTNAAGVKAIIDAQMSRTDKLAKADDVIVNDQNLEHLYKQIELYHQKYLELAAQQP